MGIDLLTAYQSPNKNLNMAIKIEVNPKYKDRVVSHNSTSGPVGEMSQYELLQLGIAARSANNPVLLCCFSNLPSMTDLVAEKTKQDLESISINTVQAAPAPADKVKP